MEAPCHLYYEGRPLSTVLYYEERSLFKENLLRGAIPASTEVLRGAILAASGPDDSADILNFFRCAL